MDFSMPGSSYLQGSQSGSSKLLAPVSGLACSKQVQRIGLIAMTQKGVAQKVSSLLLSRRRPSFDLFLCPPQKLVFLHQPAA